MNAIFGTPSNASVTALTDGPDVSYLVVPDAHLLFHAEFKRVGSDLTLKGEDGHRFIVPGYFKHEKLPSLMSPEGAALAGDIVAALAGPQAPGQYAQATAPQSDAQAIGRVATVSGNAVAVRNGVAVALNVGDAVLKGDVVQTQSGSALGVIFTDGTTFNLSSNARMVLNEFVYNAAPGSANSALINLVQGSISFIAGEVAHTGDMRVGTPVATMGIRGTAVSVEISADNGATKFSVMVEPGNKVGSFNLYDNTTGQIIGTVSNAAVGWQITPAGPLQVLAQQFQKPADVLARELQLVAEVLNVQAVGATILQQTAPQKTDPNKSGSIGSSTLFVDNAADKGPSEQFKVAVTQVDKSGATTADAAQQVVTQSFLGVQQQAVINPKPLFLDGGTLTRVFVPTGDAPSNAIAPDVSADGRFVAFVSTSQLPNSGSEAVHGNIYLYDRQANTTSKITQATAGGATYEGVSISLDGRYVVYQSHQDGEEQSSVYIYDRMALPGMPPTLLREGGNAHVDGAGNFIVMEGPGTGSFTHVLVIDRDTPTQVLTNVSGNSAVLSPEINADGRLITFYTAATEITIDGRTFSVNATGPNHIADPAGHNQIYAYDRSAGTLKLVSASAVADGGAGDGDSGAADWSASISAAGRYVVFQSNAANLVAGGDGNSNTSDIFVRDLLTGTTELISIGATHSGNYIKQADAPFPINSETGGDQNASVAALADGGFLVAWTADGDGVFAQRYDAHGAVVKHYDHDGNLVGSPFAVSTTPANDDAHPVSAGLADGGFVTAWLSDSGEIVVQRYTEAGQKAGDALEIDSGTGESHPAITVAPDGGFFIAWSSDEAGGSDIHTRRYDSFGALVSETQVATAGSQTDPAITTLSDGSFVVAWTSTSALPGVGTGIFTQRFNADGNPVGSQVQVDNSHPANSQSHAAVASLVGGGFVVVWTAAAGLDGSADGVYERRYSASGAAVGSVEKVNTTTAGNQNDASVTALTTGGFMVTWTTPGAGGTTKVVAQEYNALGNKVGGEVERATSASDAKAATLPNGSFVVTWTGSGGTSGQIYSDLVADADGANGVSYRPVISPDGRYITFASAASDLVTGDTNGVADTFVYDRVTQTIERISVDAFGRQSFGNESYGDGVNGGGSVATFGGISIALNQPTHVPQSGGKIKFSADGVSDLGGTGQLTLIVQSTNHGQITGSGLTIVNGHDGATGWLEATGTLAQINAAIKSGLVYTPPNGGGNDALDITIKDGGASLTWSIGIAAGVVNSEAITPQSNIFVLDRSSGASGIVLDDPSFMSSSDPTALAHAAHSLVFATPGTLQPFWIDQSHVNPATLTYQKVGEVFTVPADQNELSSVTLTVSAPDSPIGAATHFAVRLYKGSAPGVGDVAIFESQEYSLGSVTVPINIAVGPGQYFLEIVGDGAVKIATATSATSGGLTLQTGNGSWQDAGDVWLAGTLDFRPALTTTGSLIFTDVGNDTHSVSVDPLGNAWGDLTAYISSDTTAINTAGAVTWNYAVDPATVAMLAVGETHTDTFTLTLIDSGGGIATRDVTVTVVGTNEAPTIDPALVIADIHFSGDGSLTTTDVISGAFTFKDVDRSDTHVAGDMSDVPGAPALHARLTGASWSGGTASFAWGDSVDDLPPAARTFFASALELITQDSTWTNNFTGTVNWSLKDIPAYLVHFLGQYDEAHPERELTLTYTIHVEDSHLLFDETTVAIKLKHTAPAYVGWIGNGDGDWNTDANWSTGSVPQPGDDVHIPDESMGGSSSYNVTNSATAEVNSILLRVAGAQVTNDGSLTVHHDFNVNEGSLDNNGMLTVGAALAVAGGSVDNADALHVTGGLTVATVGELANHGVLTAGATEVKSGGTLSNDGAGDATLASLLVSGDGTTVDNDATLTVTTSLTVQDHAGVDNADALHVTGGLTVATVGELANHGVLTAGATEVKSGGTLSNDGAGDATLASLLVSGDGTTVDNDATLTVTTSLTVQDHAGVDNADALHVTGGLTVATVGELANHGVLTAGATEVKSGGTLSNDGAGDATLASLLVSGDGTTVDNDATLTVTTSLTVQDHAGVDNADELHVTGGLTVATVGELANHGVLTAGATEVKSGGTLSNDGAGDATLASLLVSGDGTTVDNDATLTVTTSLTVQDHAGVDNADELHVTGGLTVATVGELANHGVLTAGATEVKSGGTLSNDASATLDSLAVKTAADATILSQLSNSSSVTVTHALTAEHGKIDNTAGLLTAASAALSDYSTLTNAGVIELAGDITLLTSSILTSSGHLTVGGDVTVDQSVLTAAGGEIVIKGDVNDSGTIEATGGGVIDIQGSTLTNTNTSATGNLVLAGLNDTLLVHSLHLTLTAGVVVSLGIDSRIIGSIGETLSNESIIAGAGWIGSGPVGHGDGHLTLSNEGIIDANNALSAMIINTGHSIDNSGTLEATGGGSLSIYDDVINTGTIASIDPAAVNSSVHLFGAVTNFSSIQAIDGGRLYIEDVVTNADSAATIASMGGVVTVTSTGKIVGSGTVSGGVENQGLIKAQGGHLHVSGDVTGTGLVQIDAGATLELDGAFAQTVTFAGVGARLQLDASAFDSTGRFLGSIEHFAPTENNSIYLRSLGYGSTTAAEYENGFLNIFHSTPDGGYADEIRLFLGASYDYANLTFMGSDENGGTLVTLKLDNDAPTIEQVTGGGASYVEGSALTAALGGTIRFADVDLTDRPDVTVPFTSYTYTDAQGHEFLLSQAQRDAVAVPLLLSGAGANNGSKAWAYNVSDAALDFLAKDEVLTLTYTAKVEDDKHGQASSEFTFTLHGTNDAPVVSGTVTGSATEDGAAVTLNALANAADIDNGAVLSVVNLPGTLPAGVSYNATNHSFTLDPTNAAYQYLAQGQPTTVTVSYGVTDGIAATPTAASISWTITGTNDAPVVSGTVTGSATEDGAAVTLNALANAADIDNGTVLSVVNLPGTLPAGVSYNATNHSFTLDPTNAAYQYLAQGQPTTVTVSYGVTDGIAATPTTASVSWTVTGTNDAPVVSGTVTGSATEDGAAVTLNALANAADIDNGTVLSVVNLPGTLPAGVSYNATNHSFTLDPTNAAYQYLAQGQPTTVTVSYGVTDGIAATPTTASVSWTVTGTNDAPVVSGTVTGSATEDGAAVTLNALANAADIDNGTVLSVVNLPGTLPAGVSYNATNHSFTLDPTNAAYQYLAQGQPTTVTVSYGVTDGIAATPTTASVSWTITGTNDAPTLDPVPGMVFNDTPAANHFIAQNGTLVGHDVDTGAHWRYGISGGVPNDPTSGYDVKQTASSYGTLFLNSTSGAYSFLPNDTAINALSAPSTQNFTFTVTDVTDGALFSARGFAVTFNGVNDTPTTSPVTLAPIGTSSGPHVIRQEDLLFNAHDAEGQSLLATDLSKTGNGSLTYNGNNTWTYTPASNDDTSVSFSYQIRDTGGAFVSATATMDIGDADDFDALGLGIGETIVGANASGTQTLYGGGGNDTITANPVPTTVYGGSGNDIINGNSQGDVLFGGSGYDTITGNDGNDTIVGGLEADVLTGGGGDNTFVFKMFDSLASGFDTVTDFEAGHDKFAIGYQLTGGVTHGLNIVGTGNLALDLLAVNTALAKNEAGNFVAALSANGAAVVNIGGASDAGTYLIINDATAAFNSAHDTVIKLATQQVLHSTDFIV